MVDELAETKYGMLYWKLAIWKILYGSLKQAGTAYVGSTAAVRWVDMHWDERVVIIITAAIAVGTFIDGFLDQSIGRLIAGKAPIKLPTNGTDTDHLTKPKPEL